MKDRLGKGLLMSTFKKLAITMFLVGSTVMSTHSSAYARTSTCKASWYGPGFHGNTMANLERYDMNNPKIVAHKKLPFGTQLRLTNPQNQKTIVAIVKDRGPYVGNRCLDLSRAGAELLGFLDAGVVTLQYEIIE